MAGYNQHNHNVKAPLYRFVFGTRWLLLVIVVMMSFFVLHPALPVFANETQPDSTLVTDEPPKEPASAPEVAPTDTFTENVKADSVSSSESLASPSTVEKTDEGKPAASEVPAVDVYLTPNEIEDGVANDSDTLMQDSKATTSSGAGASTVPGVSNLVDDESRGTTTEVTNGDEETPSTITPSVSASTTSTGTTTDADVADTDSAVAAEDDDSASTTDRLDDVVTETTSEPADADRTTAPDDSSDGGSNVTHTRSDSGAASSTATTETPSLAASNPATTTETVSLAVPGEQSVPEPQPVTRGEFEFLPSECVTVADGSFYCTKDKTSAAPATTQSWTVKALPDSDGDAEIYFNDGDSLVQITNNAYDDRAPHYDTVSHSIVWHALVNDRYQIFSYDIVLGETTQLTKGVTNNMEPSRHGDTTVWQRWDSNNWEIMVLQDGEVKQITNNNHHDVLPDVQQGYVIWNNHTSEAAPQVMMYELISGTKVAIEDVDGGQVVNPRFVLVYDSTFANGDSITKGFDPKTGAVVTLAAQPVDAPPDIPDSDQTGETRALIQNKPSREVVEEEDIVPTSSTASSTSATTTSASATTTVSTAVDAILDMNQGTTTMPLSDYDLVVEPLAATQAATSSGTTSSSASISKR